MIDNDDMSLAVRLAEETLARERAFTRARRAQAKRTLTRRAAVLGDALVAPTSNAERLHAVRELLVSERNRAQQIVVWVYACILETDSSGITMLFDRFKRTEIGKIIRALDTIGASETHGAVSGLLARVERVCSGGQSWLEASARLESQERRYGNKGAAYVSEMEKCLVSYCREHVDQLSSGRGDR